MTKQAEIDFLNNIPDCGIEYALNKPFSDYNCANYLLEIGAIMSLLPPSPCKLLDLGCGTGWTSCFFAKRGYQVTGQDISPDMIKFAEVNREREKLNKLDFIVSDYENMNFSEKFDCAVFFDSLHHADSEIEAIQRVYEALKLGGICVISEPGVGHSKSPSSIAAMQEYGVNEKDMPPSKIIKAAKKAGFKSVKVYPHAYDFGFFYRTNSKNLLKRLVLQLPLFSYLIISLIINIRKEFNGIVVLTK
jgi:SAM-dependent methyltransferase